MIDPLAQPVTPTSATGDVRALAALRAGQIVEARVEARNADGSVRLSFGTVTVEARLPAPAQPGQALLLQVLRAGGDLSFSLLSKDAPPPVPSPPAAPAPPAAAGGVAPEPSGAAPQPRLVQVPAGQTAPRDAAITFTTTDARGLETLRPGQVIEARVEARNADGSARLSSGTATFESPLPGPVRPGHTLLLHVLRGGANPTFAVVPRGTATTGVPAAATQGRAEATRLLRGAAASQDTATVLLGTVARLAADPGRAVPQPVRDAVAQFLGLRLPADATLRGDTLRNAVQTSGIFLEASLARGAASAATAGGDMKAVLLALQNALRAWLGTDAAAVAAAAKSAPPPSRGALPGVPGAPAVPDPAAMGDVELARMLLAQTHGALSRLRLLQLASLPDPADAGRTGAERPAAEWSFELPFVVDGRGFMVQFRLERDARRADGRDGPGWRLRFAIDAGDPVGVVHALVGLAGGEVSVTLWAESDAGARLLRDEAADLGDALGAADLAVGTLSVHAGRPPTRAERSGGFVDRRT